MKTQGCSVLGMCYVCVVCYISEPLSCREPPSCWKHSCPVPKGNQMADSSSSEAPRPSSNLVRWEQACSSPEDHTSGCCCVPPCPHCTMGAACPFPNGVKGAVAWASHTGDGFLPQAVWWRQAGGWAACAVMVLTCECTTAVCRELLCSDLGWLGNTSATPAHQPGGAGGDHSATAPCFLASPVAALLFLKSCWARLDWAVYSGVFSSLELTSGL